MPDGKILVIAENQEESFYYDVPQSRLDWCDLANEIIDRDIYFPNVLLALGSYDYAVTQLEQMNPVIH